VEEGDAWIQIAACGCESDASSQCWQVGVCKQRHTNVEVHDPLGQHLQVKLNAPTHILHRRALTALCAVITETTRSEVVTS